MNNNQRQSVWRRNSTKGWTRGWLGVALWATCFGAAGWWGCGGADEEPYQDPADLGFQSEEETTTAVEFEGGPGNLLLGQGPGWRIIRVEPTDQDTVESVAKPEGEPGHIRNSNEVYVIDNPEGLENSTLPETVKAGFGPLLSSGDTWFISRGIAEELDLYYRTGEPSPELLAHAQQQELALEPLAGGGGGPEILGGCPDQQHTKSKSLSLGGSWSHTQTFFNLLTLKLSTGVSGSATGEVMYIVHRVKVAWWCVPTGVSFGHARASGSASAQANAEVTLTASFNQNWSWSKEVAKPSLGDIYFMVGAIPVRVGFNLPVEIGLNLGAAFSGQAHSAFTSSASGSFNYTCTRSGCSGSTGFSHNVSGPSLTASLTGRLHANPWAQVAIRLFLYHDALAYGQIGIRPKLFGDMWGYAGNTCGDADGDGTNEWVTALTYDLDWQAFLTGKVYILGWSHSWNDLWHSSRKHITFKDLISSSALTPMVIGPSGTKVGESTAYQLKMRPCWPYTDTTSYEILWGDGNANNASGPANQAVTVSHSWQRMGTFTLSNTAKHDSHGRNINKTTSRPIRVTVSQQGTG